MIKVQTQQTINNHKPNQNGFPDRITRAFTSKIPQYRLSRLKP